ncbi:hypothetical protein [Treponema sp. Marseille-Q3903]|uniref:hypothetical protein n=1 Tax=Treponema sp. Marseille-Q3903 TaxID=2766703 RepID=UPI0016520970|nr:hypothetical protein [Treponema sp. Marseille-Q3903]MBC6714300.1 hypothetical protein [Treponema sp. Marseille-Q3903]
MYLSTHLYLKHTWGMGKHEFFAIPGKMCYNIHDMNNTETSEQSKAGILLGSAP